MARIGRSIDSEHEKQIIHINNSIGIKIAEAFIANGGCAIDTFSQEGDASIFAVVLRSIDARSIGGTTCAPYSFRVNYE
jgi:hypothetical protein